jgi:hypothetical protein
MFNLNWKITSRLTFIETKKHRLVKGKQWNIESNIKIWKKSYNVVHSSLYPSINYILLKSFMPLCPKSVKCISLHTCMANLTAFKLRNINKNSLAPFLFYNNMTIYGKFIWRNIVILSCFLNGLCGFEHLRAQIGLI